MAVLYIKTDTAWAVSRIFPSVQNPHPDSFFRISALQLVFDPEKAAFSKAVQGKFLCKGSSGTQSQKYQRQKSAYYFFHGSFTW
jgi:hypothetical protein